MGYLIGTDTSKDRLSGTIQDGGGTRGGGTLYLCRNRQCLTRVPVALLNCSEIWQRFYSLSPVATPNSAAVNAFTPASRAWSAAAINP